MVRSSKRPRVLIADSDEEALTRAAQRLDRAGCEVLVARDGEEALACAQAQRPDLCVLDAMMPKLTGYDVTRRLRADPATSSLPVLLLTALPLEAHAFDPGANAYLRKPVSPGDLASRVRELLQAAASREPPAGCQTPAGQ
jgi:CheY-like chemotaxis protein